MTLGQYWPDLGWLAPTIDCTRKWIGNAVQNFSSSSGHGTRRSPPAKDLSYRAASASVPEVDESMIQLPFRLLVVGAVSLPLKCEYFL